MQVNSDLDSVKLVVEHIEEVVSETEQSFESKLNQLRQQQEAATKKSEETSASNNCTLADVKT